MTREKERKKKGKKGRRGNGEIELKRKIVRAIFSL